MPQGLLKAPFLAAVLNRNLWIHNLWCFMFPWKSMKSHHFLAALKMSWGDYKYSEILRLGGPYYLLSATLPLLFGSGSAAR